MGEDDIHTEKTLPLYFLERRAIGGPEFVRVRGGYVTRCTVIVARYVNPSER